MEFACSHVVCNWRPESINAAYTSVCPRPSVNEHPYDNRTSVLHQAEPGIVPPPLPPRPTIPQKQARRSSTTIPPPPSFLPPPPPSAPPAPPPRSTLVPPLPSKGQSRLRANVNVVSLSVGKLVDTSKASGLQSCQRPVICGKCSAALSSVSSIQINVWLCEFCGKENALSPDSSADPSRLGPRLGAFRGPRGRDVLYLPTPVDDDYQNLEDSVIVFCVDISGSMSVTTEVTPGNSMRSATYISRLQGIQDALQRALQSLLQSSPHRRVALVTFNDEVVVYGDGTREPMRFRDWALIDYDHIWQEGAAYGTPHCIAECYQALLQRVKELRDHGATCLGPAAVVSVAMASRYPGSKVILCTDGRANIGLGAMKQIPSFSSSSSYFYRRLAHQAAESGVIISIMTFEGTDCRLAEVGLLADSTGGRVNIVNIGTVATEIQSAMADNILATGVTLTLLAPDGMYFPYEDDSNHKLVREIGNVTEGLEITFQFAVKEDSAENFLQRDRLPFQLQLSFKTRDQQKVTRIITEQRRVTTASWVWAGSLNMAVLGVHCAQLCARLTMEGRVHEAQRQLKAQQVLLTDISEQRPAPKEECIYGNWIDTMTTICDNLTSESEGEKAEAPLQNSQSSPPAVLSDEAAKVVYQMKRASSVNNNILQRQQRRSSQARGSTKKPREAMEAM